jgi:hypothetical protein
MDPESTKLFMRFQSAMINRDAKAARRIGCEIYRQLHPDDPINIAKVEFATRHYAKEMHGWDMP